jgi:histidine triad (HIT) family protein
MSSACVFCKILQGETAAHILYRDELVTAFRDIHPKARIHYLIVPNQHYSSLNDVPDDDDALLGHMINVAKKLAVEAGVDETGYRLVINTGPDAGQSVPHIHLHLLGGGRILLGGLL